MQQTENATNGTTPQVNAGNSARASRKGTTKQWKDLATDPLADGFDEHHASYIVGRTPLTWEQLGTGKLFSRSKLGKSLHVKLDSGRATCLDTGSSIEVAPRIRRTLQVWQVTFINTTSAKTDF